MKNAILLRASLAVLLLPPLAARAQFLKKTDDKPAAKEVSPPEGKKSGADELKEGGPTVVCDGKKPGGYRVAMNGKDGLLFAACLRKHEESHIEDYVKTCPDGCKGQADGTPSPMDAPRCAAFETVKGWRDWRADSECKAYAVERACLKELFQKAAEPEKNPIRIKVRQVRCRLTKYKCEGAEPLKWYQDNCKE